MFEIIEARIQSPLPNDFEEKYRAQTALAFEKDIQAVDGVKTLVEQLKVPFCVASSGPEHKIKLNLSLTGLISHLKIKCLVVMEFKSGNQTLEFLFGQLKQWVSILMNVWLLKIP